MLMGLNYVPQSFNVGPEGAVVDYTVMDGGCVVALLRSGLASSYVVSPWGKKLFPTDTAAQDWLVVRLARESSK